MSVRFAIVLLSAAVVSCAHAIGATGAGTGDAGPPPTVSKLTRACPGVQPASNDSAAPDWAAVVVNHWGLMFWGVGANSQSGAATIDRYRDPGGGRPSVLTFPAEASWDTQSGAMRVASVEERPPLLRVSIDGRIRPNRQGGDATISETDRPGAGEEVSAAKLDGVVLMGRREAVFARLAAMYECASAALSQAGWSGQPPATETAFAGAVPVDERTIAGEWTGLTLLSDVYVTLRVLPGGKAALGVTRASGAKVTTEVLEGTIRISGKSFSLGGALDGALLREWGAGFGHGWLRSGASKEDGVEVYFFMQKDSPWMSSILRLNSAR